MNSGNQAKQMEVGPDYNQRKIKTSEQTITKCTIKKKEKNNLKASNKKVETSA